MNQDEIEIMVIENYAKQHNLSDSDIDTAMLELGWERFINPKQAVLRTESFIDHFVERYN